MVMFSKVALLHAHPRLPLVHDYHISDLVELCGLAACIREHVDEVAIPVTPNDRDPLAAFDRFVKRYRPDLVGISCFTCSANSALRYAEIAKRHGAVVVTGGYHPSARPEEMLRSPHVDAVVRGEGEETLTELARSGSPREVAGLSFTRDGGVVHNPDRPLIDDLDALPLPLRSIRPPRFGLGGLDYHTDTVYGSRGCRGRCTFCANHLVGKRWRPRGIHWILEELRSIRPPRQGAQKVVKFWDSSFLADAPRVAELCDGIIAEGLDRHFRFIAETRVEDVIRARGILPRMREAGFVRLGCGIESPNRDTVKELHKGINLAHVEQASQLITDAGLLFSKFLIIGHAHESEADILRYPEYALSHGVRLQNTTFMVMTPYPATELERQYEEQGLITSRDWDLYTNLGAVTRAPGVSTGELQALLCSVTASYGMGRRFQLGKSGLAAAAKLFEPLLTQTVVMLLNRRYARGEIEGSLWHALATMEGSTSRERDQRRRARFTDRIALCFHCQGKSPVLVWQETDGDRVALRVEVCRDRRPLPDGVRTLHIPLAALVTLGRRLDGRALIHDIMTGYWNRRALRISWLAAAARNGAVVTAVLARILAFNLRAALGRVRSRHPPR